jgi:hypothetical protein
MPFFLYREEGRNFALVRSVALAGQNGPFCIAAKQNADSPEWELSEDELIRSFEADSEHHAVIIDLKPRMKEKVSLYRIRHAWGYSSQGWTPFALELEALYVDFKPPSRLSATVFKKHFPIPTKVADVYEFLYLNGDGKTGTWSFGKVGSVNAPLLWAEVFDSFITRINQKRRYDGRKQLGLATKSGAAGR